MSNKFFNNDFLEFFIELASNNNKEWFDKNKKRYLENVKIPFENFVEVMIEKFKEIDSNLNVKTSNCIFRINRDIRFSKDKTPYKLNVSAAIAPNGKKDFTNLGIYFELGPEHIRIYSGLYMIDKDMLDKLRNYIATHITLFNKLISDKKFVEFFGEIKGEKAKKINPELKEIAVSQPLLFNKQFYYFSQLEPEKCLENNFDDLIWKIFKTSVDLGSFLHKGISE